MIAAAIRRWFNRPAQSPPLDLTPYRGQWVAVKGGRLVGHKPTAAEIIDAMVALGPAGHGTTIWFEARPEEVKRWAVMDAAGRIGPNCYFDTEDEARWWLAASLNPGLGTVVTRAGQHDPWVPSATGSKHRDEAREGSDG